MTPRASTPNPDPADSPETPRTPPAIADHELIRIIGRGSYGDVWLARNIMGAWRAVKIIYRDRFQSSRPFDREFSGIQRYEPISRGADGLVPVLHVGRHEAPGSFYYVMELADPDPANGAVAAGLAGPVDPATYAPRTLRAEIDRLGRLTVEECIELGHSLLAGLAHLHRHRLVHRDLKPANIVFIQGQAKLADLGLVGGLGDSRTLVGTEGYIPPEGPGSVGADLYALGKVLYEAVSGLSPDEFPNPPSDWLTGEVPTRALELHEIILRACESNPERRYRSSAALQADLALLRSGQSVRRARRLERRVRTLRRAGAVATALAVLGLGLGLFAAYRARVEHDNAQRAGSLQLRAEKAEAAARTQLADAQLSRAGLERRLGLAGHRFRALSLVRDAAASSSNLAGLRTEATAALTLADLRQARTLEFSGPPGRWATLDAGFERHTRAHPDGSVRVHSWADGRELATLEQAQGRNLLVWPFSDGGRWVGGRRDREAWVWDTGQGRIAWHRTVPDLYALDLLPMDRGIALQHDDGRLDLIQLPEGTTGLTIQLPFRGADFWCSPDGRHIAVFSRSECRIHLFDAHSGGRLRALQIPSPACPFDLFWAPDGRSLLVSADDFCGYILSVDQPGRAAIRMEGHTAEIVSAAFHPSLPWVVTGAWDGTTRLWNSESGRPYARHDGGGANFRWRSDGRLGWLRDHGDGRFQIVEMETALPEVLRNIVEPLPPRSLAENKGPWDLRFLADDRVLAVGSYDGVRLWPVESSAEPHTIALERTRWLEAAPDGQTLWLGNAGEVIAVPVRWDGSESHLRIGAVQRIGLPGHEIPLAAAGMVPGTSTVLAAHDTALWQLDPARPRFLGLLPRTSTCLNVSPDGRWILAGQLTADDLMLASGTNGAAVRPIPDSRDARGIFSTDSRSIFVLSLTELRRERVLDGTTDWRLPLTGAPPVRVLALSPDGTTLATTHHDREIALHDAGTGELWTVLDPPDHGVIGALHFGTTGRYLAAATTSHTVQVWDLSRLRTRLKEMNLDWPAPPPAAVVASPGTIRFSQLPPGGPIRADPAAPATPATTVPIDLSGFLTHTLAGFSSSGFENRLQGLTPGPFRVGDVEFDLRGVIQLGGNAEPNLPRRVDAIPIHRVARQLHFLHASTWDGPGIGNIGQYLVRHADGTSERIPLVHGENIHDWWFEPALPTNPAPVWQGANPVATAAGRRIGLFHLAWTNPHPASPIESVAFETPGEHRLPFLVALSVTP